MLVGWQSRHLGLIPELPSSPLAALEAAARLSPASPVSSRCLEKVEMGFIWAGASMQKVVLLVFAPVCWCKSRVSPMW